jgi:hypothetical protein
VYGGLPLLEAGVPANTWGLLLWRASCIRLNIHRLVRQTAPARVRAHNITVGSRKSARAAPRLVTYQSTSGCWRRSSRAAAEAPRCRTAGRAAQRDGGRTAGRAAQRDGPHSSGTGPHSGTGAAAPTTPTCFPKQARAPKGSEGASCRRVHVSTSILSQYKYSQSVQVFSVSTSIFKYVATHAQAGPAYWQPPKELLSRQHPTVKLHQIWCAAYHVTECCLTAEICLLEERRDQLHVAVV